MYHSLTIRETSALLDTDTINGLSEEEARIRKPAAKDEVLRTGKNCSALIIPLFAAILCIIESAILVLCNALPGYLLMLLSTTNVIAILSGCLLLDRSGKVESTDFKVYRQGFAKTVKKSSIALGDILLLEKGSDVPCDIRLIESSSLLVDESLLTGESEPVVKYPDLVLSRDTPYYEQTNMLFEESTINYGTCKGIAVEKTLTAAAVEEPYTVEQNISFEDLYLILAAAALILIIFYISNHFGLPRRLTAILITPAVCFSLYKVKLENNLLSFAFNMANRNKRIIIRSFSKLKLLQKIDVACFDKTGILTEKKLEVKKVWNNHIDDCRNIAKACILSSRLFESEDINASDTIEKALYLYGKGFYPQSLEAYNLVYDIPLNRKKRMTAAVYAYQEAYHTYIKGALENVLPICGQICNGGDTPSQLTVEDIAAINAENEALSGNGYKVIALCSKISAELPVSLPENGCTFLGLAAIRNNLDRHAIELVQMLRRRNVAVKVLTGDHPANALHAALSLGLLSEGKNLFLSGKNIEKMSLFDISAQSRFVNVYCRLLPHQKGLVINGLKKAGKTVMMIGHGLNDLTALKQSDLSVCLSFESPASVKNRCDIIMKDLSGFEMLYKLSDIAGYAIFARYAAVILIACLLLF